MAEKRTFILRNDDVRRRVIQYATEAPIETAVTFGELTRSLDQNAAQWPILQAFADQLQWPVNGQMVWLSDEEWKDILTAAFEGERVRLAQGLDGGVVMLGRRTSKFGKKKFSDWLEFLHATAAARDVDLHYREYA